MLFTSCCLLHAVHCLLFTACCSLHAVYCMLFTTPCSLHAVYCMLFTSCCSLHAVYSMLLIALCSLYAVHCMLLVACCSLHAVHCRLFTSRCSLHAVYAMLFTSLCSLHAVLFMLFPSCSSLHAVHCMLFTALCSLLARREREFQFSTFSRSFLVNYFTSWVENTVFHSYSPSQKFGIGLAISHSHSQMLWIKFWFLFAIPKEGNRFGHVPFPIPNVKKLFPLMPDFWNIHARGMKLFYMLSAKSPQNWPNLIGPLAANVDIYLQAIN